MAVVAVCVVTVLPFWVACGLDIVTVSVLELVSVRVGVTPAVLAADCDSNSNLKVSHMRVVA